ncbi:hypothetical protein, conserved [Plasmodium gonderi]|uniref:HID1 domain-containing protein n=1 Tax=Plasmodium gonderi TaxID=77519 RepID=A0A1Y1JN74_PLAGO|nr:hypothetical protein, conserved [Plasmodium gonderi]GAW82905.1 hypothetical protein, conserved [Plasmodium gonderi]
MGHKNSKRINSVLEKLNDKNFKESDLCTELSSLGNNLCNDKDFFVVKKIVDDERSIYTLFKFLMSTLRKLVLKDSCGYIDECKACVKIWLMVLPVIQYNYQKKEVFNLLWKENNVKRPIEQNYIYTNNIIILHMYNFFLITLFTEDICIKKRRSCNGKNALSKWNENTISIDAIDVCKLWIHKFSIHSQNQCVKSRNNTQNIQNNAHNQCMKKQGNSPSNGNKRVICSGDDLDIKNSKVFQECTCENGKRNGNSSLEEMNPDYGFSKGQRCLKHYEVDENATSNLKNLTSADIEIPSLDSDINLELIKNRTIILKCLLILLSSYIYLDERKYLKEKNFFLFLFTSGEVCYTANFFFSLLNVIYDNEFNYFNFFFYDNTYLEFYNICIHLMNILIDFNPFILENNKKIHYMNDTVRYFYSISRQDVKRTGYELREHVSDAPFESTCLSNNESLSKNGKDSINWGDELVTCGDSDISDSASGDSASGDNASGDNASGDSASSDSDSGDSGGGGRDAYNYYHCEDRTKEEHHQNDKDEQRIYEEFANSPVDFIIFNDSLDESTCNSSSTCTDRKQNNDMGTCEIQKKKKRKKKIPHLEHVLRNRKFYLKEINGVEKNSNEKKEKKEEYYYDFLKKQKWKKLHTNNVYIEMLRKLDASNIEYIYKGALNILISYKLYYENYNENVLFIHNYLCLLWHLMNNNRLFIKHMKNHSSSVFLFHILYILICFNHQRRREMQALANMRKNQKEADCISTPRVHIRMASTKLENKTMNTTIIEDNNDQFIYNNENFNESRKCDDFNIRKIDGLIYICLFIILKVSSNSTICKNLNQKYDQKIKVNFQLRNVYQFDSYVDFLVYSLCMLINDNIFFLKFERIIDMSITILTNVSVYIKSMNTYSCECIISILKKVLKKEWILSSQNHYYALFLILDFINNILSHNLNDNHNFIYMIIKNKDVFFSIHNLDQVLKSNCLFSSSTPIDYWVPTESWLVNWKNKLPMQFINSIIYDLANLIEEECDEKEILDYNDVVDLIKHHCSTIKNYKIPFIIRKYEKNILLSKWVTSYIYFILFFHLYKENLFINSGIKFIF